MHNSHGVFVQRRVNTCVPLNIFARANQSSHATTTNEGLLESLEPIRVAAPMLVIRLAKGRKGVDHLLVDLIIVEIQKENENV